MQSKFESSTMSTQQKAHLAGFIYFIVAVTGMFSLAYVPSVVSIPVASLADAAAALAKISTHQTLYKAGIASSIICYVATLMTALALLQLLHAVNRNAAVLMVAFAASGVPIALGALGYKLDLLTLIAGPLVGEARAAQAFIALKAYSHQMIMAETFWGLWLLPMGYLVFKSGFLPKILGVFLMVGCFSYLLEIFGPLLFAGYAGSLLEKFVLLPASIGELGICFWLLIFGARRKLFP
jgi:Domain of unknown function (DUF4386)